MKGLTVNLYFLRKGSYECWISTQSSNKQECEWKLTVQAEPERLWKSGELQGLKMDPEEIKYLGTITDKEYIFIPTKDWHPDPAMHKYFLAIPRQYVDSGPHLAEDLRYSICRSPHCVYVEPLVKETVFDFFDDGKFQRPEFTEWITSTSKNEKISIYRLLAAVLHTDPDLDPYKQGLMALATVPVSEDNQGTLMLPMRILYASVALIHALGITPKTFTSDFLKKYFSADATILSPGMVTQLEIFVGWPIMTIQRNKKTVATAKV